MLDRVGKETSFIEGLRVTDDETMEIVEMVLVGKINKHIVNLINRNGGRAVGLSGKDGSLIMAQKRGAISKINGDIIDIGHVGDVKEINPEIIQVLASQGYIPVISPVGVTRDGISLNINADHVAGEMAGALKADKLILLTDVEGVFEGSGSDKHLLSLLTIDQAYDLIQKGEATSGMIPKLEACIRAVESGAGSVHIIDGRKPHSILLELFTDEGIGTMVMK
jgi:acetylglutamate kinase